MGAKQVPHPPGVAAIDVPLAYPICAKAGSAIMFHQGTFHGGNTAVRASIRSVEQPSRPNFTKLDIYRWSELKGAHPAHDAYDLRCASVWGARWSLAWLTLIDTRHPMALSRSTLAQTNRPAIKFFGAACSGHATAKGIAWRI